MRDQTLNERALERYRALFEPKSMAVIGVSTHNDRHPANVIFNKNRLHYPLEVYAVNPSKGKLQGEPVYASVSEIPGKVDLAVIVVRAEQVRKVLADCIEAHVGAGVIISGGFAEAGRSDLQEEIAAAAREADFPFLGPNCIGMFSPPFVDTNFIANERIVRPNPGNIALVCQSGGILIDLMIKLTGEGTGLSRAVSIGNKALIREQDLLDYFIDDDRTRVIAFYVEGFGRGEGRTFLEAAAGCSKPIVVLKSGKSPLGTTAVSSHTASLAGDYRVFSEALAQYGVVEAKNETELVNFCESLSRYRAPVKGQRRYRHRERRPRGNGGRFLLRPRPFRTRPSRRGARRAEVVDLPLDPAIASLKNPFDLTGSATDEDFAAAVAYLWSRPEIDFVIALLLPYLPGISMDLGARLSFVAKQMDKMLVAYVPHVEKYQILTEGFELNGVPGTWPILWKGRS